MNIRPERPADIAGVRRTNELAFGRAEEAELVDALRSNGAVALSLVAEVGGEIVGHVLFSPVEIEHEGGGDRDRSDVAESALILGLAPMAVLPSHQRRGVGTALIRDALDRLRRDGCGAVVVLGHPDYYPRFGFTRASGFGLRCEFECPDEAFMALELRAGALGGGRGERGVVRYRPELGGHGK